MICGCAGAWEQEEGEGPACIWEEETVEQAEGEGRKKTTMYLPNLCTYIV